MSPIFNAARLSVEVGGLELPALSLSGTEGLSQPFRYILDILAPPGFHSTELLDLPARIILTGCDGCSRTIAGIVTALEQQNPHPDGRGCFRLTVESALARLRLQHDTRIFLHQSVPQIIETVLVGHGIAEDRLCLRLSRHYPVRPWSLQVNESDFEFLSRLLAREGIFFWSEADADGEQLFFSDHNAQLPERCGAPLQYRPGGGMEPESCGIRALQVRRRLVADQFEVQEKSRQQPSQALHAQAGGGKNARLRHYRYAAGADHLDEAQHLARIAAEESRAHSFELHAQAEVADLSAGQVLCLDAARLSSQYSGDYLVSALSLRMSQRAGEQAAGGDLALQCETTLIPRETQWRPPQPPRPEIHHQAHTDHQHRATQNLQLDAGRNLEMTSAGRLCFDMQRGQKLAVNGPEATFSVRDGEIDLFFTVKNFQGGETAQVRVFERDAEGSLRQIDALHCLLDDGFGHYRLSWSRSGAQVQDDLIHDANALDPSPLTYLFDVRVGDIHSENSPSLHLTTRLHFTPRDWQGRPLAEGREYHLVDGFGQRQTTQIHQGELCFDEAVVGPWQLLGASDAILFEAQE
ncbi:type VI secretion system Vgr family protein [Geoalkalibacter subterraneus]|uniref:Gp5/Type VI secretion system Vgr protein OB-fold domain-containing protein n=1 Tax=Geoalkalibacter subterraneus TaxID=483547 RepID=A0A0B5FSJ1_9BACT|nr:phage late control D family protein [Geoalkalibacter subterraneus]AJF07619.1 hypothetical protein GSUB_15155 [Geoalkalibacter subterraneus]